MEPLNPDESVWRYLDLAKFIHQISSGSLFFPRADSFEDPFEGTINSASHLAFVSEIERGLSERRAKAIKCVYLNYRNEWVVISIDPTDIGRSFQKVLSWFRCCTYVNSWHRNTNESEAMWRLYTKNLSEAVVIRTTVEKLQNAIPNEEVDFSPVEYVDYQGETVFPNYLLSPFKTKRIAFSHEREARLIFQEPIFGEDVDGYRSFDTSKVGTEKGKSVPLATSFDSFIDEVRMSPISKPWMEEVLMKLLEKFSVKVPLRRSEIQPTPFVLINGA